MLDDIEVWSRWMDSAAWWNYILMASGIVLFVHSTHPWWSKGLAISIPRKEWEIKAKGTSSFKLYEAACLLTGHPPAWPLPTDKTEEEVPKPSQLCCLVKKE